MAEAEDGRWPVGFTGFTVVMPEEMHRELKIAAAERGLTMREICLRGLRAELARQPEQAAAPAA